MRGKTESEARAELDAEVAAGSLTPQQRDALLPHKIFPGNRPSNTLLYPSLDPHMLGMLIALYEHKIFVQGALWNVNSFDQWGVELGKQLAKGVLADLTSPNASGHHDSSTAALLAVIKQHKA